MKCSRVDYLEGELYEKIQKNNNNNNNNNNNAVAFQGTMSKLSGSNERRSPSQDRLNDNVYDDS